MPIGDRGAPVFIAGRGLAPTPMAHMHLPFAEPVRYRISGVTRDSTGAALGNCEVEVYETVSNLLRADTISDANGNYSVDVNGQTGLTFYVVAYKTGSPDLAGTTVNSIVGV